MGASLDDVLNELRGLREDLRGWLHEAHKRGGLGEPVEITINLDGAIAKMIAEKTSKDPQ